MGEILRAYETTLADLYAMLEIEDQEAANEAKDHQKQKMKAEKAIKELMNEKNLRLMAENSVWNVKHCALLISSFLLDTYLCIKLETSDEFFLDFQLQQIQKKLDEAAEKISVLENRPTAVETQAKIVENLSAKFDGICADLKRNLVDGVKSVVYTETAVSGNKFDLKHNHLVGSMIF